MNYREIEEFKSTLMQILKKGCRVKIDTYGIDGKIIGVGFKPYWTNPADSKIDKVEFDILCDNGKIMPFYLQNVIGSHIKAQDGKDLGISRNLCLEIYTYSLSRASDSEPYDKLSLLIYK